jgi:thymidylate synthase
MTKVIPTLHIVADNIPQAHYRATKAVHEKGMNIQTQYDRKNSDGSFKDPPSKDAKVLIEISNPFNQPRYSVSSYCEIGTYIAEIMGIKDHLVLPLDTLREQLKDGHLKATQWPYSYHQRLFAFPDAEGSVLDQMSLLVDRVAQSPITRRAVATTRLPSIDAHLKDDIPCLGEVQLRCTEDSGELYLHMDTKWRSRDLFKAWADNVIGLTFMQQVLAREIGKKMSRVVHVGSYSDYSSSLHIYGQDYSEKGVKNYIELGEEAVLGRAMNSDDAADLLVVDQINTLARRRDFWKFSDAQVSELEKLALDIKEGRLIA